MSGVVTRANIVILTVGISRIVTIANRLAIRLVSGTVKVSPGEIVAELR